jgi:hypothetical protein
MKRLHVHVSVEDLAASVRFYKTLFAAEPTILKGDYAKWMLEDPRVNFAISQRGADTGIRHLGIQVENRTELDDLRARLQRADAAVLDEGATTCCYVKSEKSWTADPQGVRWETFLTTDDSTVYGSDPPARPAGCCGADHEPAGSIAGSDPVVAAPRGDRSRRGATRMKSQSVAPTSANTEPLASVEIQPS